MKFSVTAVQIVSEISHKQQPYQTFGMLHSSNKHKPNTDVLEYVQKRKGMVGQALFWALDRPWSRSLCFVTTTVTGTQLSLPSFRQELHDSPPSATQFSRCESGIAS
jgi:hypothetical protein